MAALEKLDRNLLATYLIALFVLLMFPISEPKFRLLGIASDKLMHVALFGGLAMLLRWTFSEKSHAVLISISIAFAVAAITEVIQAFIPYRSAEWLDLLAGTVGAIVGAGCMNRILASPSPEKLTGVLVAVLGVMIGAFSLLADAIGIGGNNFFGPSQIVGTVLGIFLVAGGITVFKRAQRGNGQA